MKTHRIVLFVALGGATLTAASLLWAADNKADELEKKLDAVIQDRIKTAERGVEANQAAYDSGTVTLDQIIQSRKDLAEARLAAATTAAEREAALEEIVAGTRLMEEKIAALYRTGSRGGEANQMAMVTVARQSAEIRLLEEQLRNARAK